MPRCPACSEPLDPIELMELCPREHGVFVSGDRLPHVLPRPAILALDSAPSVQGGIECPRCEQAMLRRTVPTPAGPMVIDACAACGGHWFDEQELMEVTRAYRASGRQASGRVPGAPVLPDLVEAVLWGLA